MNLNTISVNIPLYTEGTKKKYRDGEILTVKITTATDTLKVLTASVVIRKYAGFDNIYIAQFQTTDIILDEYQINNRSYLMPFLYGEEDSCVLILVNLPSNAILVNEIDREKYPFIVKKEVILPLILNTPNRDHPNNTFKMICMETEKIEIEFPEAAKDVTAETDVETNDEVQFWL